MSQNAVRHGFPALQLVGCLFHLGMFMKESTATSSGIVTMKTSVSMLRSFWLLFGFVASVDNTNALEMLVESCPTGIDPVLVDYWEDNHFGRQRRDLRAEPRFAYGNTLYKLSIICVELLAISQFN